MRAAGLAALLAAQLATPTVAVMVQTPSGTVEGFTVEGVPAKGAGADGPGVPRGAVEAFLGVPFAAPPVGELRWHSPRPIAPWTGTKHATSFAPDCANDYFPQDADAADPLAMPTVAHESDGTQSYDTPKLNFGEDCLYLNLWRPAHASPAEPLPVMVWFYGGGWNHGGTASPLFDGSYQVAKTLADGKPVISVTVNYRLGAYGFLAHEVPFSV
jgi:para-nitrobenzyl esterase